MNKYHAQGAHDTFGRYFPSKGEKRRAGALMLMQKAGEIRDLKLHPTIDILPNLKWKLDSSYVEVKMGRAVYEDYKGIITEGVRIKAKIWAYTGPGVLRFVGWNGRLFFVMQEIIPLGLDALTCSLRDIRNP